MTWTFCTSGAAIAKAGLNANSTITASGAALANWSDEAEAYVNALSRVDLVTAYASLTAEGKKIADVIASSHIAQQIIAYDMAGYTSRLEAQTMLDVLENNIDRNTKLIKEGKVKTYLAAT